MGGRVLVPRYVLTGICVLTFLYLSISFLVVWSLVTYNYLLRAKICGSYFCLLHLIGQAFRFALQWSKAVCTSEDTVTCCVSGKPLFSAEIWSFYWYSEVTYILNVTSVCVCASFHEGDLVVGNIYVLLDSGIASGRLEPSLIGLSLSLWSMKQCRGAVNSIAVESWISVDVRCFC